MLPEGEEVLIGATVVGKSEGVGTGWSGRCAIVEWRPHSKSARAFVVVLNAGAQLRAQTRLELMGGVAEEDDVTAEIQGGTIHQTYFPPA